MGTLWYAWYIDMNICDFCSVMSVLMWLYQDATREVVAQIWTCKCQSSSQLSTLLPVSGSWVVLKGAAALLYRLDGLFALVSLTCPAHLWNCHQSWLSALEISPTWHLLWGVLSSPIERRVESAQKDLQLACCFQRPFSIFLRPKGAVMSVGNPTIQMIKNCI